MKTEAKWITSGQFAELEPLDVFHKELDVREKNYDEELLNSHVLFRKRFEANGSSYIMRISADDYYRLYINGRFVCSGPAPGYPWHYYYNELDVTKYVKKGENLIAVHTYYQGLINRVWVSGDRRHGLFLSLTEDGKETVCSDGSFKCRRHSGYTGRRIAVARHDTLFSEKYDSGAKEVGFEKPDFDDRDWEQCKVRRFTDYELFDQQTRTLEYTRVRPSFIEKRADGVFVDVGREVAGYVTLSAKGAEGETLLIRYAEELENGEPMYHARCYCEYEDEWILSGGRDTFVPFDYKGFRYVKIVCEPDTVDTDSIEIVVRHYPFTQAVTCPIDDETVKRVWDFCEKTIEYGTQECFVDCPTREKGQYLGDLCVSSVSQAILTGKCDMLKKSLVDFAQSARICPGLMAVSTSSFMQEIADYSLIYTHALTWYFKLSDDKELLGELYPAVEGLREYFRRYEREDGLLESVTEKWNLVDWPDSRRDGYDFPLVRPIGPGVHNVLNAFYIGMIKDFNKIRAAIGLETEDTERYEKAYRDAFFDAESGLFTDREHGEHSALHSNVLPLFFGIVKDAAVKENIIGMIKDKGVTTCGTYFSYFIMQALKNEGRRKLILDIIKDKKAWLNMMDKGGTTAFEAWDVSQKKNCSLFHPWSCTPIMILYDM